MKATVWVITVLACASLTTTDAEIAKKQPVNEIAEAYVKLVLAMGEHDKDYVDAFYGPAEWKTNAAKEKKPLATIREEAMNLFGQLTQLPVPADELERCGSII